MTVNISGQSTCTAWSTVCEDFCTSARMLRIRMTIDWESWGQLADPGLLGKWRLRLFVIVSCCCYVCLSDCVCFSVCVCLCICMSVTVCLSVYMCCLCVYVCCMRAGCRENKSARYKEPAYSEGPGGWDGSDNRARMLLHWHGRSHFVLVS